MGTIRKLYMKADQFARGQTMTEYAMIVSAIAVICYAGYQTMGTSVCSLVTAVNPYL